MSTTTSSTRATSEDVILARHRDLLAPERDRPATDAEMDALVSAAVAWSFSRLSPDERDDIAQEVRLRLARRYGWHPPLSALDRPLLARKAASVYKDSRNRWADVKDASAATDAEEHGGDPATRTDAITVWAGQSLPAADVDWRAVVEGLGYAIDSAEGAAIYAALSGYGSGAELATALAIPEPTARKRLERGRERLARRYPTPELLADALADVGQADRPLLAAPVLADPRANCEGRWPTNGAAVGGDRVQLDSVRRFWLALLDRMAPTTTAAHAASMDSEQRLAAPASVAGPTALLRWQPERVSVRTRRAYRTNGAAMDSAPERRPMADSGDPDRAWLAATTPSDRAPAFQPMTVAESDAATVAKVNAGALASCRSARRWDRRRKLSRLSGATRI